MSTPTSATTVAPTALQDQIDTLQQQMVERVPPERIAQFTASRKALEDSGLVANSLHVGERAPEFTLPDAYNQPVTLSALLTNGPVVITFYRGDWCPYCNLTLRAYQAILPQITALHGTLVAISPQTPDFTTLTVEHKELTHPVLSDYDNQVARQFRLVWQIPEERRATSANLKQYNGTDSWELPMSGTFVIGQDGIVKAAAVHGDWAKRMEPAAILEALRQLQ